MLTAVNKFVLQICRYDLKIEKHFTIFTRNNKHRQYNEAKTMLRCRYLGLNCLGDSEKNKIDFNYDNDCKKQQHQYNFFKQNLLIDLLVLKTDRKP